MGVRRYTFSLTVSLFSLLVTLATARSDRPQIPPDSSQVSLKRAWLASHAESLPITLPTPPVAKKSTEKVSTVQSKPLTVSIEPDENVINAGEKVILIARPVGGKPPYSYKWYSGDQPIDFLDDSVVWTLRASGTRIFRVMVTDASGNTAEARSMAIVRPVEAASVPLSPAGEWAEKAKLAVLLAKYDEALEYCQNGIEMEPAHAELYSIKGQVYTARQEYDLALEAIDRAISLDPENGSFYYRRSIVLKKMGRESEARAALDKVTAATPKAVKAGSALASPVQGSPKEPPSRISPTRPIPSQLDQVALKPEPAPDAEPISQPAPTAERGVLAQFSGYDTADTCSELDKRLAGVPWSESLEESGPVGTAQNGQYYAMLRHTMQGLRVFYGKLTPQEDKSFNAFWAPFFDHPTAGALEYFQKINPLLDETAVTVNRLDGLLANLGGAMQETLITIGDPGSTAPQTAKAAYQGVKTERAKLDDLLKQINSLGNPPNPLASKCGARKLHNKAIGSGATQRTVSVHNVLETVKNATDFKIDFRAPSATFPTVEVHKVWQSDTGELVLSEFVWDGNDFKISRQGNNYKNLCSDENIGHWVSRNEITGGLSDDGMLLKTLTYRWLESSCDSQTRAIKTVVVDHFETGNIPVSSAGWNWYVRKVQYGAQEPSPDGTQITAGVEGTTAKDTRMLLDWLRIEFSDSRKLPGNSLDYKNEVVEFRKGQSVKTAASEKNETLEADQLKQRSSTVTDPERDPKVLKEAIDHHLALADQIRKNADRWASDAVSESNPDRKKELLKRAVEMRANAQAEQDLADSIRTGTLVHSRTEWDDQQHQALLVSIKTELAVFDAEHKLITNIPKVGDMLAGADGLQARAQLQQVISDAIKSPDAVQKLSAIYSGLQSKVKDQGEQEMADARTKVEMWDRRVAVAEGIKTAAGAAIMLGSVWAPVELGSLALGYAGATGFAEDGVKGGTMAVVRSISNKADVIISAYEGAVKIDPETGEPGGAWGAIEGALWTIGTNKVMEGVGGKIQKAKADYALARQAAGAPGVKPVARATGEGRLKEYDFQMPEQRYKNELSAAKSPEQIAAVNKKHAIQAERDAMHKESLDALKKAEDAVRSGTAPAQAKEQYDKDLNAINEKYAAKETRNQEHKDVMKELGFDPNTDIKSTGSDPKTAASDMDFTPQGNTPHEAYQKGKQYTEALKTRGHNVQEYGDRWVDTTTDATIWKPGFGSDKPGSSSFEAEVIFGTMPHSDKFGTKGGVEWTSSPTHSTDDPLGAVLANTGKAVGAGLGNSRPTDLHTVGKSAAKAAEAAGIEVDPQLKSQIDALRAHQTPEQAGIVTLGADKATKDKQLKTFLGRVESLMGSAYRSAKAKSDQNMKELEQKAAEAGNSDEAYRIRSQIKAYQAGDNAALTTISQVSPGLAGKMEPGVRASDLVPSGAGGNKGMLNLGGLAKELLDDRMLAEKAPPFAADGTAPAFAGLDDRCGEAAKRVAIKLAAAKPGSDEARYLADLRAALLQGEKNPAEAVRQVRGLSGTDLAVVLAQLGVSAKVGNKP